jgi:hypothetical protein
LGPDVGASERRAPSSLDTDMEASLSAVIEVNAPLAVMASRATMIVSKATVFFISLPLLDCSRK